MTKIWYASVPDEPCRIGKSWWSEKVVEVRVSESLSTDEQIQEVIKGATKARWAEVTPEKIIHNPERDYYGWAIHTSEWGLTHQDGKWEDLDPAVKPRHFRIIKVDYWPLDSGEHRISYKVSIEEM